MGLAQWDADLLWYARAVDAMRKRPSTDPTSWNYQAGIHGFEPLLPAWSGAAPFPSSNVRKEYWNQCQHGSWYFLPWHRMYLAYFEQIVGATIVGLGGPAGWALPFWNYSDPANPKARMLPAAFSATGTPDSPTSNPLHMAGRELGTVGNLSINPTDVDLGALDDAHFIADVHGGSPGFGGRRTGFNHNGGPHGKLEHLPHDMVHMAVGGVMGDPRTAALDPIFWLHHANIDRLWEVWRHRSAADTNPTDAKWLTRVFDFHTSQGAPATMKASQVLDTTKVLTGYTYEGVTAATTTGANHLAQVIPMRSSAPPELVAASEEPQQLGSQAHTMNLALPQGQKFNQARSANMTAMRAMPAQETFLNFENIVGTGVPPVYDVYLKPPGATENSKEYFAGSLPMFGIEAASVADEHQSGSGTHYVLQVNELLDQLRSRSDWKEDALQVTLAPRTPLKPGASVTIGRISLYVKPVLG